MISKKIYIILFVVLSLWGCTKGEENLVRIAVVGPMTGDQSKQGTDLKNGVELAVEEWNEKGGVLGKKIKLFVEDDQHDPKQAVAVANKLVNSGVIGVIGHWNSSATIPASDVYNRTSIPMITPASTNPQVTERGLLNVFRICGRDDQQGKVAAEFALKALKAKKIAILHDKTTYGQGLADEFKKGLGDQGLVVFYDGLTQGEKDYRAILTSIKGKTPDLFFFGGIYPEGGLLARQAREVGITAPMLSGDGVIDPVFVEIAGPAANGTYLTFAPDTTKLPAAKEALERYRKSYGEPGPYSFYAFDAANVLLTGISKAATTEGKKVSETIHSVTYDGITGRIQFDQKGDVPKIQYVVWITRNGKFEEYWRPDTIFEAL